MWRAKQARGQFRRHNPTLESTLASASDAAVASVTRVLGAAIPGGSRGSHEFLDFVMGNVNMSGSTGGRTSDGVYFGLSALPVTAECDAHLKGAWVAISPAFVSLIERVAAVAVAFPRVLREVYLVEENLGDYQALEMLGNIRSSAFHYWDTLWHEADPEFDTPELWEQFIGTPECVAASRAAVAFTLCHETAHLTQGDHSARIDRALRSERETHARAVPPTFWPVLPSHRDELTADWAAANELARIVGVVEPLGTRMVGSIVATIATGLDGWNQDQAALSETHPSPFLRLECLLLYWCSILARLEVEGWGCVGRPDPGALEWFAQVWGMGGWAGGRYREGRDGLGIFNDVNDAWGYGLQASGHSGVFMNSHSTS